MEIVNVIQKELNKTVYGDSQEESKKRLIVDDVNEDKYVNEKDVDVEFVKHYTEEEVLNLRFKKAAENGEVVDLTEDDATEVLKPQKTLQQLEATSVTKLKYKETLKKIIKKVLTKTMSNELLKLLNGL